MNCPCHSLKPYKDCCYPYHIKQRLPENALILMRSRYSAYALHLADYIMETTHPSNSAFSSDTEAWSKEILNFTHSTKFVDLKILEYITEAESAFVTFTAFLKQGNHNTSFTEKSTFVHVSGKWLYASGDIRSGFSANF